jgi:hypothetical protein
VDRIEKDMATVTKDLTRGNYTILKSIKHWFRKQSDYRPGIVLIGGRPEASSMSVSLRSFPTMIALQLCKIQGPQENPVQG